MVVFRCEICDETFRSADEAVGHYRDVHWRDNGRIVRVLSRLESIFFDLIKKYNEAGEWWTHYVDVGDGVLLVIEWEDGRWKCPFRVEKLEKLEVMDDGRHNL